MDQIAPMLATTGEPFDSPDYSFEIKWDGVRSLAAVEAGSVWRLWGRHGADYTARYPELSTLLQLPAGTVLDGELVQLTQGRADFAGLLRRHQLRSGHKVRWAAQWQPVTYVVFDLLKLAGRSLLGQPLCMRRESLAQLLAQACPGRLTFSAAVANAGREFFRQVVEQGHEGVMAKRLDSLYIPGKRSPAWQKIKPRAQIVAVIMGYRAVRGTIGSLLLAAHHAGELRYVGEVSAGLTKAMRANLEPILCRIECATPLVPCLKPARWVQPELCCLVQFIGWTGGAGLRFPVVRRLLSPGALRPGAKTVPSIFLSSS